MIDAWWEGYEAGLSGQGSNPHPIGAWRVAWEFGHTVGCQVLATILEDLMTREQD